MSVWVSLVLAASVFGPPKLPPMPGQSTPAPTTPATAKLPTQQPKPAPPAATATTTAPAPTTTSTPTPAPAPTTVPAPGFSVPDAEPPQPEIPAGPPPRDGAGSSPRMGPERRPERLPGGEDEDEPRKQMPPPLRPPYKGIGLFIGAGVTFGVALAEQIAAHVIVKRRCIDPVAKQSAMTDPFDSDTDAEEIGNAVISCVPGILPVIALRVNSDLALLATIGMVTAGAMLRAERVAYDDAFASRKRAKVDRLRGAGIGLIALGATTWLTMSPASWGVLAKCDNAKCAGRARAMGFSTRDVGAVLIAAGAGMLAFAETYRRKHEYFSRERAILWAPAIGRGYAGVSLQQRF